MSARDLRPTTRFGDRAEDYVKFRPGYPPASIDAVLEDLGPPSSLMAADIGAGPGICSRLLAERGLRVIAVEPNGEMRAVAQPHSLVTWRDGTAESTGLDAASCDLVLCAQAFHWFEPQPALREFHRILKPRGRLALVWNKRDVRDPFTAGYRQAILDSGGDSTVDQTPFDAAVLSRTPLFEPPRLREFANEQRLDLAGLIGRARSVSYAPKDGPAAEHLTALLTQLYADHRDAALLCTVRYVTKLFITHRRG